MQETLLGVTLQQRNEDGAVNALIEPPSAGLDRAEGSVPTVAGPVHLSWQRQGKGMTMGLTVPANATATVRLPTTNAASVRESGTAAAKAPGVTVQSAAAAAAAAAVVVELSVGSGTYRFTSS
jgi:alpha-L-rhamnosidase